MRISQCVYHFKNFFSFSPHLCFFYLIIYFLCLSFPFSLALSFNLLATITPLPFLLSALLLHLFLNLHQSAVVGKLFSSCFANTSICNLGSGGAVVYTSKYQWGKRKVGNVASTGLKGFSWLSARGICLQISMSTNVYTCFICWKDVTELLASVWSLSLSSWSLEKLFVEQCMRCCQGWLIWFGVKKLLSNCLKWFPLTAFSHLLMQVQRHRL